MGRSINSSNDSATAHGGDKRSDRRAKSTQICDGLDLERKHDAVRIKRYRCRTNVVPSMRIGQKHFRTIPTPLHWALEFSCRVKAYNSLRMYFAPYPEPATRITRNNPYVLGLNVKYRTRQNSLLRNCALAWVVECELSLAIRRDRNPRFQRRWYNTIINHTDAYDMSRSTHRVRHFFRVTALKMDADVMT